MTDTEQNEGTGLRDDLREKVYEIETRHPWGLIAFLGAWAFLLISYWF